MRKSLIILIACILSCVVVLTIVMYVAPHATFFHGQTSSLETDSDNARFITSSSTPGAVRVPIFIYHNISPDFTGETEDEKKFNVTP